MKRCLPILLLLSSAACGSATDDSDGSTGLEAQCTSGIGRLSGVVYLPKGALLTEEDVPADQALVLVTAPGATAPVAVKTDGVGHYSVELDEGDWSIEGEHESSCFTLGAQTVSIAPCGEHELDLVLEDCYG